MVNRYIHGGGGSVEEAVSNIGFPLYRTKEMESLISYMRDYNEYASEGEDIRFYGFDMQRGLFTYKTLLDECKKLNLKIDDVEDLVKDDAWNPKYDFEQRKETLEALREILSEMEGGSYAEHLANLLVQNCTLNINGINANYNALRDSYMKEDMLWILMQEEARGNDCIFISGHNGHVKKVSNEANMGSLLFEELGSSYYVIGTDFYKTTCNLPRGIGDIRTNQTFYSYDPLAKAAYKAGFDVCWLDFSKVPEDSSLKQFTAANIHEGVLGEGYSFINRIRPMTYRLWECPEKTYDSMIYVPVATPTEIKTNN